MNHHCVLAHHLQPIFLKHPSLDIHNLRLVRQDQIEWHPIVGDVTFFDIVLVYEKAQQENIYLKQVLL